jgi:hypothetical protein
MIGADPTVLVAQRFWDLEPSGILHALPSPRQIIFLLCFPNNALVADPKQRNRIDLDKQKPAHTRSSFSTGR